MFNDPNRLTLDIKAQDRLREWFSKRGDATIVQLKCIELGDSDVDYEMSQQVNSIKILNSPYDVERIKHRLYYSGVVDNITGKITTFLRRVNAVDQVESLYNYPSSSGYTAGVVPPTRANGFDFNTIAFDSLSVLKEGFIVYYQTLPDNYFDSNGVPQRLIEQYVFTFNNVPSSWEVILDQTNGSFLIAKPAGYTFLSLTGTIQVDGTLSTLSKTITFNY